jgi:hypothetical protein
MGKHPFKTEEMIRRLIEKNDIDGLKKLSQQMINNAFYGIRFGMQNSGGVHGACPLELLHAILLGLFMRVRDCFFDQLGATSKTAADINSLAKLYGKLFTRQSNRDLPKTNFANGIQKGKLMGKEYSGVLLVMAAILESTLGQSLISKTRGKSIKEQTYRDDWQMLVETLLCWEAFLKLDEVEMKYVKRLEKKHRYLMYLIKKVLDRQTGMGFKTIKHHALLHLHDFLVMYGVAMNFDTGSDESQHKTTKVAAKLTQKNMETFESQTEKRLTEFHVIDLALCELEGNPVWTSSA